ncbi:AAA domain-containing protein [Clostridium sp. AM58-1XD]|uniref:AAA domain-containing protein n=1 Tax=Clostridium sp. AM58-1XD TaxID=2292307 RepID=UPI0015F4ACC1|nr:AAA domain-containing protein [Clostridium sp. AM58-1XD]
MDRKQDLVSCLRYSKENHVLLEITSANGKNFPIQVTELKEDMVLYLFSNGTEGKIRLSNIQNWRFINPEDQEKYEEQQVAQYFSIQEPGKRIQHFQQYYQEILMKLQRKQAEGSVEYGFYDFRLRTYAQMFTGLLWKRNNLLLSYLMGDGTRLAKGSLKKEPLLLLQQSNLSQKSAVHAALENRVSVIEGPPGTGKTTTIISIIANMVYRGQKVLIVSKNNSAIDNVAEELEAIQLPDFYVRMGNEKVMKSAGARLKEKLDRYKQSIDELRDRNNSIDELQNEDNGDHPVTEVYQKLTVLEEKLNRLTAASNELDELKNQLKHLEKRREAYGFSRHEKKISRRVTRSEKAKRKLDFLSELSVRLERGEMPGLFRQLFLLIAYRESLDNFRTNGICQILFLEEAYLRLGLKSWNGCLKMKIWKH